MPATVCHAIFATEVYNNLGKKWKVLNNNDLGMLKMFGQNTDPLMFYNVESLGKGKDVRKIQYLCHSTKTASFFITLCEYIKREKLYDNNEVMAFLYGFICHYVLDYTMHPFIVYKSGIFDKNNKETFKYNCKHHIMETYIDNVMITTRIGNCKEKPFSFRLDKFCFDTKKFSSSLNKTIDYVFDEVYHINNMSFKYYKSLKQMKRFLRRYRYDKYGLKMCFYKIIDLFTDEKTFKFFCLSYNYMPKDNDYLNEEKKIWYNPLNPKIKSTASFDELYEKALLDGVNIITNVNEYFYGKKINLKNVFDNKSYLTGLNCELGNKCTKFEF